MDKKRRRKLRKREKWAYIQFRIKDHERATLKQMCLELNLTIQEFMERLLMARLPKESPADIPGWVEKGIEAGLSKANNG